MSEKDLVRIVLPDAQPLPSPYAEADRRQAVEDLLAGNSFRPNGLAGPFGLAIMVRDGRLILDIRDAEDKALHALVLALGPFRRLVDRLAGRIDLDFETARRLFTLVCALHQRI
jgi:uncharacterized protein (UPF0262 family)